MRKYYDTSFLVFTLFVSSKTRSAMAQQSGPVGRLAVSGVECDLYGPFSSEIECLMPFLLSYFLYKSRYIKQ